MIDLQWWERWPHVLAKEVTAFEAAGFKPQQDPSALAHGIMRYELVVSTSLGEQRMSVVYPDCYPYFRCQVYAPGLKLDFHQNPFEKNLCLIGRRTHFWNNRDDTAAGLIARQLEKVLMTAAARTAEEVEGLEEAQAEPFSEYYTYQPSMLMVQSDWSVPPNQRHGTLKIATLPTIELLPSPLVRGAVLSVRGEEGSVLCEAPGSLRTAFCGKEFEGKWMQVDQPIHIDQPGKFIQHLLDKHPDMRDFKSTHVTDGWLRVWGVVFPEQTRHRVNAQGWIFACAFDKKHPKVPVAHYNKAKNKQKQRRGGR